MKVDCTLKLCRTSVMSKMASGELYLSTSTKLPTKCQRWSKESLLSGILPLFRRLDKPCTQYALFEDVQDQMLMGHIANLRNSSNQ